MKHYFFILLLAIGVLGCVSLNNGHGYKVQYDKVTKRPKQKLVPPGTIWLHDSLFIDECEVTNLGYLEYVLWTQRIKPAEYLATLPDTNCWNKLDIEEKSSYAKYYFRSHYDWQYPVVGVTYEQAVAFCKWRTDRVNQYLYLQKHPSRSPLPPDSIWKIMTPRYVEYTLPTKEDWQYASNAGHDYYDAPLGYQTLYDKDHFPVNITAESDIMYATRRYHTYGRRNHTYTMSGYQMGDVKFGTPNSYGIYNLLGNVSEIIADSAFKGLSFHSAMDGTTFKLYPEWYHKVDSTLHPYCSRTTFRYTETQPWLGFRCVCVVKQIPE